MCRSHLAAALFTRSSSCRNCYSPVHQQDDQGSRDDDYEDEDDNDEDDNDEDDDNENYVDVRMILASKIMRVRTLD